MKAKLKVLFSVLLVTLLVLGVNPGQTRIASAQSAPGSNLRSDVPASADEAQRIPLESIADFNSAGGKGIFEPATSTAEEFTYAGIDGDTSELIGITRSDPTAHPQGSFVEAAPPESSPSPQSSPSQSPSSPSSEDNQSSPPNGQGGGGGNPSPSTEPPTSSPGIDGSDNATGPGDVSGSNNSFPVPNFQQADSLASAPDPCQAVDCQSLLDLIAQVIGGGTPDPCDPNNGGVNCGQLIQDILDKVTLNCDPNPNGTNPCVDGDIVIQLINNAINFVCDGQPVEDCLGPIDIAGLAQQVLEMIVNVCDRNGTGRTCLEVITQLLDDQCDPNNTGQSCDTFVLSKTSQTINSLCHSPNPSACVALVVSTATGLVDTACSNVPGSNTSSGAQRCVDKALGLVASITTTVNNVMVQQCGSTSGVACAANLIDRANDTVANACKGTVSTSPTTDSDVTNCTNKVMETVNLVLNTACQSSNTTTCMNNLLTLANSTIAFVCSTALSGSSSSTGAQLCVDKATQTINNALIAQCGSTTPATCATNLINRIDTVLGTICSTATVIPSGGSASGVPPGAGVCVLKVLGAVNLIMSTACQTTDAATCINTLIDKVNDTVANVCKGTSPTSPTGDSAVADCTNKVLDTVNGVLIQQCQSTTASTCATNLLNKIDTTVGGVCGGVPIANGGNLTGVPPGAGTCVLKVVGVINLVLTNVCHSTDSATCVNNLLNQINASIAFACNTALSGSSANTGLQLCVDKAIQTVNNILIANCGSKDPAICATNLLNGMDRAIGGVCGSMTAIPNGGNVTGLPTGAGTCVLKLLGLIDLIVTTGCGTKEIETCIDSLTEPLPCGGTECLSTTCANSPQVPGVCSDIGPLPGGNREGCPPSAAVYDAETLPPLIPPYCEMHGKTITDHGTQVVVGPPGTWVWQEILFDNGQQLQAQEINVETLVSGAVVISDGGDEQAAEPGDVGGTPTQPCEDDAFDLKGRQEGDEHKWYFKSSSFPTTASFSASSALSSLRAGVNNITHEFNNCDRPDPDLRAHASYQGDTSRAADFRNSDGGCQSYENRDHQNTIDFGVLGYSGADVRFPLAATCTWGAGPFHNELSEADERFDSGTGWTLDPGPNCSTNFDLESVQTHEVGHVFGLAHVEGDAHRFLTMYPSTPACTVQWRTLGLGDMEGLELMYGR